MHTLSEQDKKIESLFYVLPGITAALLLAMAILFFISPVSAATPILPSYGLDDLYLDQITQTAYTAPDGLSIAGLEVRVPFGSTTTFTINAGTAQETSGSIIYTGDLTSSTETITIGGTTNSFYFPGNVLHPASLHHIGVAFNNTGERGYYVDTEILTSYFNQISYITVANATPITTVTISSDRPVNVKIITQSYEKGAADLAPGGFADLPGLLPGILDPLKKWTNFAWELGGILWDLVNEVYWWLKFLFWDNLLITIALYVGITGAMAFGQNPTQKGAIFKAIKTFIGYQMALFRGIVGMWQMLINVLNSFVNIFK